MYSKIPHLNAIDLANNASLPSRLKLEHLSKIVQGRAHFNLDPVRNCIPSILLADPVLPLELSDGSDDSLMHHVSKLCRRGDLQRETCLAITSSLIEWRKLEKVRARFPRDEIPPFRMKVDATTVAAFRFASDVLIVKGQQAFIVALDLRSNQALTRAGREVVGSVLSHTAKIGPLANAGMAFLRTPSIGGGKRKAVFEEILGAPKYDLSQIDRMFAESLTMWRMLWVARRTASARSSDGSAGLM